MLFSKLNFLILINKKFYYLKTLTFYFNETRDHNEPTILTSFNKNERNDEVSNLLKTVLDKIKRAKLIKKVRRPSIPFRIGWKLLRVFF